MMRTYLPLSYPITSLSGLLFDSGSLESCYFSEVHVSFCVCFFVLLALLLFNLSNFDFMSRDACPHFTFRIHRSCQMLPLWRTCEYFCLITYFLIACPSPRHCWPNQKVPNLRLAYRYCLNPS
jgi:hypothetical protein